MNFNEVVICQASLNEIPAVIYQLTVIDCLKVICSQKAGTGQMNQDSNYILRNDAVATTYYAGHFLKPFLLER
ncbi:hypothetical protein QE152_g8497 [Popillia japonica]|uniref:Uncharacterized protein n=1 Tax=Popillia japonica TaxID=7064 RepID=A0AAW1MAA1_POPJA